VKTFVHNLFLKMVCIWHIIGMQASGEAQEVLSLRQGPVRHVRFLVHPSPGTYAGLAGYSDDICLNLFRFTFI